jgi:hypothetical protein
MQTWMVQPWRKSTANGCKQRRMIITISNITILVHISYNSLKVYEYKNANRKQDAQDQKQAIAHFRFFSIDGLIKKQMFKKISR